MLLNRYTATFCESPDKPFFLITVPLRVCPLGAHSDHQGGIVTGFTIDRSVQLLARAVDSPNVSIASANFNEQREIDLLHIPSKTTGDWGNYVRGAAQALTNKDGQLLRGFRGVIHGSMPIGGLSSSAAVTIAYLQALQHVHGASSSNLETIMLVRAVENGYLGLHNGILDQSVIISGKRDALTCIDCAAHTIVSLDQGVSTSPWELLVVYSGLSRQLTATPFNQRVAECHEAARELLAMANLPVPEKPLLGEVELEIFERYSSKLPEHLRRRATHFYTERARVVSGMERWAAGDINGFGSLVTASGESSIRNYESGSPALIALYERLADIPGVYGTRFCGGGFQGCCLALIDPRKRDSITEALHASYAQRHPELLKEYSLHFCSSTDSVSLEVIS
jgi:galactokinase